MKLNKKQKDTLMGIAQAESAGISVESIDNRIANGLYKRGLINQWIGRTGSIWEVTKDGLNLLKEYEKRN